MRNEIIEQTHKRKLALQNSTALESLSMRCYFHTNLYFTRQSFCAFATHSSKSKVLLKNKILLRSVKNKSANRHRIEMTFAFSTALASLLFQFKESHLPKNSAAAPRTPPESPCLAFFIGGTLALRIKCGGSAFGKAS